MSQFDVTEDNTKYDLEISEWVLLQCYQVKVINGKSEQNNLFMFTSMENYFAGDIQWYPAVTLFLSLCIIAH